MFSVSLAGLRAHKRRLVGIFVAIFLGVAFLAGTLVLSATLSSSIDGFFARANAGTDVVVRNAASVSDSPGEQRGPIAASVVDRVRDVDGVAAAEPMIQGFGQIVGRDGKAVSVAGPRVAGNWIDDRDLNPYRIAAGRAPVANDEVVVNRATADLGDLHVGDRTKLLTPAPIPVTVVGIVNFGNDAAFGRTSYVGLTFDAARRYVAAGPAEISTVAVKARPGLAQDELVRRISAVLPPGVEAISGSRLTAENIDQVNTTFLTIFRTFLSVFAAVALLVATFSIYNTFSILVAQRTRESALLRAIGASRRQVLTSVVVESLAIGTFATAAGLAGGVGLAALLKSAFAGLGFDLPTTGLVFTGATAAICIPVGIGVTLLAALAPAVRASRVPALAALRDVAFERARPSVRRIAVGVGVTAAGVALALSAIGGGGGSALARAGIGAILTVVGVVVLGPVTVRSVGAVLGTPARLRGTAGILAQRNTMRNPRRTAGAAAALTIGVAVVALFTVFAASLKASTVDGVRAAFTGDLAISASQYGDGGLSPQIPTDLSRLPQVAATAGVGSGSALVDGDSVAVAVANPVDLTQVVHVQPIAGSVHNLGGGQLAVTEQVATDHAWHVGSAVPIRYADGAGGTLTLGAIYRSNSLLGNYLVPEQTWRQHTSPYVDATVYVALADGVNATQARQAVTATVATYGAPDVRDRQQLIDFQTQNITQLLGVVYVMLALAILIALMGIANTLSLAIHERGRELGLLRAVGATRRQIRAMVRWEAAITALFGAVVGIALGTFLGWVLVRASDADGTAVFSAPASSLAIVLIIGALAGVLAGLLPARRAARLPLLPAIATE